MTDIIHISLSEDAKKALGERPKMIRLSDFRKERRAKVLLLKQEHKLKDEAAAFDLAIDLALKELVKEKGSKSLVLKAKNC